MNKPACTTIRNWLKANLGKRCLAPITGTDDKALNAAVQVAVLWTYCDDRAAVAKAFGVCVNAMQPSTRYLAYHAIAHVSDWSFRAELWNAAELGDIHAPLCAFERGGSGRDMSKEG